ncbi:PDR/VanB family oxidoreductase [Paralcaligenes ureilyticus]|uniref:Vanillate O-demethylase ferredoxin subunit n=1 Tax=Paralcaligenes ureilyticus TaxID=627131 RepID=A0A4R3LR05_9BURK|nr:PDR/VanB family oxidoreductase [Paralcaligenes ureilyticus]TCT02136.1 vanillate O-demethylase ferredoxin subunit [Paralcaligenes ureilyticus]
MTALTLTVSAVQIETPLIRSLVLTSPGGEALPAFTAGSHLKIHIPGKQEPRCYSLVCLETDRLLFEAPTAYRLGVRIEDPSTGGSQYMHQLKVGDTLDVEGPKNDFPLHAPEANEDPIILIAGGIGITPVASMAATLRLQQRLYELHYYGRSRDQMSFVRELAAQHGSALRLHADDDAATLLPLPALLTPLTPEQHLYVCGPKGLIDAVIEQSHGKHWPHSHVHFELFANAAPQAGDQAFEVELRQSGRTLLVPPDKTILEVLEDAGCDPLFDCRRGECGVCQATVLEGTPDHRDYYLSDDERAGGQVMQICISRSHSARLVLDL